MIKRAWFYVESQITDLPWDGIRSVYLTVAWRSETQRTEYCGLA
jgi:hypothetical protein